jgi:hypothetical protein
VDGDQKVNNSIPGNPNLYETGQHLVLNDSQIQPMALHLIVNGKGAEKWKRRTIRVEGHRCIGECNPPTEDVEVTEDFRYWSDPASWESGVLPVEDDDVEIQPGWNMVLDLAETPILKVLQMINISKRKRLLNINLKSKHGLNLEI